MRAKRDTGVPMRIALVLAILAISGLGLLGSSIAVQQTTDAVTYKNIDEDLSAALDGWASNNDVFNSYGSGVTMPPNEFYVAWIYPDGSSIEIPGHNGRSAPDLTQVFVNQGPTNVGSSSKSQDHLHWRAEAQQRGNVVIVVAKDISQELAILQRLRLGQLIIGLVVLFLIAIAAQYTISRTLRPLREVEETATAIAAGDLDCRVPCHHANTEVGSLALAFNVMVERLQEVITELQDKEETMRRFVGDASHELRTPLTSVKGYAELYRSGATDDANLVIEKIESEANRMGLLVEDLLALTRAEGAPLSLAPVDILELSLSVVNSLNVSYPERNIHVRSESEGVPMVAGDTAKLHRVLSNLVTNAIKHGGEDASVTVGIRDTDTDVIVTVTDDGVGMSPHDVTHIFERFYRADTSRTRATGGSGLGLAITKSLVEAHGGTITVSSVEGEGTVFTVTLPKLVDA